MKKRIQRLSTWLFLLAGLACGNAVSGSTRFSAGEQPQKKEQKVKVMVRSNGTPAGTDTIIVTNMGSTVSYSAGSVTSVKDTILLAGEGTDNGKRVVIYVEDAKGQPGKDSVRVNCFYMAGDSLPAFVNPEILSPDKIKRMVIMQNGPGEPFGLAVPHPGSGGSGGFTVRDPFAFDASDPDIVSYKKKDVGKGQEKIIIIRKKKEQKEVKEVEVKVVP